MISFSKERHWETQALVDALLALKDNETTTYDDLAGQCGVSATAVKRRRETAKRILLQEHGVVVEAVRGVGMRRLNQADIDGPTGRHIKKARSQAKRGIKLIKHGVVDFSKLSNETRSTIFMQRAVLGVIALATDRSSRRVLKEYADITNSELRLGRTLELLK